MHNNIPSLGIDFGGVIMPMAKKKGNDTQFSENFLSHRPHSSAFDSIKSLVRIFDGNIWIVSKAGESVEHLTRTWLVANDFFLYTGFPEEHLYFCKERIEKKPICIKLNITHFIDDRIHIMQILKNTVPHLFLFGDKKRHQGERKWTTLVENWNETHEAILKTLIK